MKLYNILREVSEYTGIEMHRLKESRTREYVYARALVYHFAWKYKTYTSKRAMQEIFWKDPATVLHAMRTIEDQLAIGDEYFTKAIETLTLKLRSYEQRQESIKPRRYDALNQQNLRQRMHLPPRSQQTAIRPLETAGVYAGSRVVSPRITTVFHRP